MSTAPVPVPVPVAMTLLHYFQLHSLLLQQRIRISNPLLMLFTTSARVAVKYTLTPVIFNACEHTIAVHGEKMSVQSEYLHMKFYSNEHRTQH
jgi:hypothetical protein